MGQKVDPRILRTSPTLGRDWNSIFYAENTYRQVLIGDFKKNPRLIRCTT